MIDRQRIATYGIATTAAATIALAIWLRPWSSGKLIEAPPPDMVNAGHRIDVVFAVDTTASMGGLLDGAKRTVWSIATHIREIDKQADLHVGLVAYRDIGDEYVTKDLPLTSDMDAVFAELSSYVAAGGGDTPEDVDAALFDAVHKMEWRDGANKMIFLVGDAPPASRGDVPRFEVSARDAGAAHIKLNTVRCGQDPDTAQAWQQIAMLGNGAFSTIQQDGGVQQVATPYDDKIAALSAAVDETTVIYGDSGVHHAYASKMGMAKAAPPAAKADRAAYFAAKPAGPRAPGDIVSGVESGEVSVDGLVDDKLPAELQGKSKGELKTELDRRAKLRGDAQVQIKELAQQRARFIHDHEKAGKDSFDSAVKATVEAEMQ